MCNGDAGVVAILSQANYIMLLRIVYAQLARRLLLSTKKTWDK